MVGEGNKTEFGAPALDLGHGIAIVLTVELDTCIAHLADLLQGTIEISLKVCTDAVELDSYREFLRELGYFFGSFLAGTSGQKEDGQSRHHQILEYVFVHDSG